MAFAASVLSFMLENLQKPVVLTGAQVTRPQSQRPPGASESGRGPALGFLLSLCSWHIRAVYCRLECVDTLAGDPAWPLHSC